MNLLCRFERRDDWQRKEVLGGHVMFGETFSSDNLPHLCKINRLYNNADVRHVPLNAEQRKRWRELCELFNWPLEYWEELPIEVQI